jgi:hypothetical protein
MGCCLFVSACFFVLVIFIAGRRCRQSRCSIDALVWEEGGRLSFELLFFPSSISKGWLPPIVSGSSNLNSQKEPPNFW